MKLEKRDNSVFISHGGLTVFFNALRNRETGEKFYSISVNKAEGEPENRTWTKTGNMTVNPDVFADLTLKLASL